MEILSPEQIRLCDLQYLDYKGVESIDLMENAALALKNELVLRFSKESVFQILCGTGNNGGDGLALARLLKADGYKVEVEVFRFFDKASKDFTLNFEKLKSGEISFNEYNSSNDFYLYPGAIIVDALFGVGLIGVINFAISFGLAFFVALKSRGIHLRDYPEFLGMLGRYFKKYPRDFIKAPRERLAAQLK